MEKKERVALIIPPSCFLASEKVLVSLGILRVAAVLEAEGYPVEVLDLNSISNYAKVASEYVSTTDAKIFGLTMTTPQFPAAKKVIEAIRLAKPEAHIICGGPHVTTTCASHKREKKLGIDGRGTRAFRQLLSLADCLVSGDGERAIFVAINKDAPPVVDADELDSPLFIQAPELASYPFPARHLIQLSDYAYQIDGVSATSIVSQMGCPFGCIFCGARLSPSFRKVRIRPIENVLAEIREIYEVYGYRGLNFLDDELDVNVNFTSDLLKMARLRDELKVEFRCRGFLKAELLTEPMAKAMYEVGFRSTLIGFESADPRILINIKKRATVSDNTRALEILKSQKIQCKALLSIGHPGESQESIEATKDWVIKMQPDDADLTLIQPYPSTPIFDMAVENSNKKGEWVYTAANGDKLYMQDIQFDQQPLYYKGVPGSYEAFIRTDFLTSEELVKLRDWAEREIREKLNIPYYPVTPSSAFEHSMGQGFPNSILRSSASSFVAS